MAAPSCTTCNTMPCSCNLANFVATDRIEAAMLGLETVVGNGDQYRSIPAVNQSRPHFERRPDQSYFYRAMSRDEARGWLCVQMADPDERWKVYQQTAALKINGHGGWASYADYSKGYIKPQKGITHLVEVYAPDFITKLAEIGVKDGKAEKDDISWGVGETKSNAFNADKQANKQLKKQHAELFEGKKVSLLQQSKDLTPYIFCQSIRTVKVVGLYLKRQ